ncbi:spermidine synthase-like [Oscarella lobularis]|uniref:spermidine synthase-like n=1 Tax=Oscarella lobularis TaxID=121494 RepID=UPI003313A25B
MLCRALVTVRKCLVTVRIYHLSHVLRYPVNDMEQEQKKWFVEKDTFWPGQAMCIEIEEWLYDAKSKYQHIQLFKSKRFGNVLVLDGIIQCTERDESAYHEIIVHVPLLCHPNPKKVLVVGGGDGGAVREAIKHPSVEKVVQCELDEDVIKVCKEHFPGLTSGYQSEKLVQRIGDGAEYLKSCKDEFDVIITDSSDPIGPAKVLFEKDYYKLLKQALKPDGILCSQGECMWLHLSLIKDMLTFCRELFPVVSYCTTAVPTYPCGQIGFILCSKNPETNFRRPLKNLSDEEVNEMQLKYYNSAVHGKSFVLPQFASQEILN